MCIAFSKLKVMTDTFSLSKIDEFMDRINMKQSASDIIICSICTKSSFYDHPDINTQCYQCYGEWAIIADITIMDCVYAIANTTVLGTFCWRRWRHPDCNMKDLVIDWCRFRFTRFVMNGVKRLNYRRGNRNQCHSMSIESSTIWWTF